MTANVAQNKFYHFNQNNSGGKFVVDERVTFNVIIEAQSAREANEVAESVGIYFDGLEAGRDCPCCGERWLPVDDRDGDLEPVIFGEQIEDYTEIFAREGSVYARVYHMNGIIKDYRK